jgi:hypothetical protein
MAAAILARVSADAGPRLSAFFTPAFLRPACLPTAGAVPVGVANTDPDVAHRLCHLGHSLLQIIYQNQRKILTRMCGEQISVTKEWLHSWQTKKIL